MTRAEQRVLVVAAHPDDEVLGCGGTIARHVLEGDEVHVLIMAEGVTSRDALRDRNARAADLAVISDESNTANGILGVHSLKLLAYQDNRMDSIDLLDIIKVIEGKIKEFQPSIIYTHNAGDLNIDHCVTHKAVLTASRPAPNHSVRQLFFFEIPSSTEWRFGGKEAVFSPNWFVDITDTLALKLKALGAYQSEMNSFPHPRSAAGVEHLSRWRGATVGVMAAEAFILGRGIV